MSTDAGLYADRAAEAEAERRGCVLLGGALTRRDTAQALGATQAYAQAVPPLIQELRRQGQMLGITRDCRWLGLGSFALGQLQR
jgi:hypothetical protein